MVFYFWAIFLGIFQAGSNSALRKTAGSGSAKNECESTALSHMEPSRLLPFLGHPHVGSCEHRMVLIQWPGLTLKRTIFSSNLFPPGIYLGLQERATFALFSPVFWPLLSMLNNLSSVSSSSINISPATSLKKCGNFCHICQSVVTFATYVRVW